MRDRLDAPRWSPTLTIRPQPRSRIPGSAASTSVRGRQHQRAVGLLPLLARVVERRRPSGGPPVLVTRISTGPSASTDLAGKGGQPIEVGGVGLERDRLAIDRRHRLGEPFARAARDRDARALARKRVRDPATDPAARSHDQGGSSGDPEVHRVWKLDRFDSRGDEAGLGEHPVSGGIRSAGWRTATCTSRSWTPPTRSTAPTRTAARCTPRACSARAPSPLPTRPPACPVPPISRASPSPPWSGSPTAAATRTGDDAQRESRGMAVRLRPPGPETDILAVTTPAFVAANVRRSSWS